MKATPPPLDASFETSHPDLIQLGTRLRTLRQRARLTQKELAHRAGLHRGTIADIERGRRSNIWFSTARRLATALGLQSPQPLLSELGLDAELAAQHALSISQRCHHQGHKPVAPNEARQ